MNALRKLRGLLGVGITWGTLWAGVGAMIGLVIGIVTPEGWTYANPVLEWALGMGAYGLVSGLGFGTLLSLGEGRKRLLELSLPRVAFWGVLGSAAVPLLFGALGTFDAGTTVVDVAQAILLTASLGGASAPAAVVLARRAALEAGAERAALGAGEDS